MAYVQKNNPFKKLNDTPQPKKRKGDVYVGRKPGDKGYVEGDEYKMSDKPMYDDHSPSTHLMSYGEADGKFVAFPTLFQDDDGVFYEPDDPFRESINKKEIYQFNTEEEAKKFADGSWKNKKNK